MQLRARGGRSPLTTAEFNDIMKTVPVDNAGTIAVAVSGGGDSMALTYLLHEWCLNRDITLHALTVDHGLRPEAEEEAKQVGNWLAAKNINHHILAWSGEKPDANIQDAARKARYGLLVRWCEKNNVEHLFAAHHQDDQAETFLIRLFRGSGIDGLSAMDPQTKLESEIGNSKITLHRPLLKIPGSRLLAFLENEKHQWIEDPSNEDMKFTRIKVRELLSASDIEGLDSGRLAATVDRMKRVKSLLDDLTDNAESKCVTFDPLGFARLKVCELTNLHEEVSLRLLSRVLRKITGGPYPPRHSKLETLNKKIKEVNFSGQTLMGAIILPANEDTIVIAREASAIEKEMPVDCAEKILWDKRLILNIRKIEGVVRPLDNDVINQIFGSDNTFKENACTYFGSPALRDRIMPSLPYIMTNEGEVMLPDILIERMDVRDLSGFSMVFKE